MKLSDLNKYPHVFGNRYQKLFDNGFGVSVIPEPDRVHYELAVMKHEKQRNARLVYDSGITKDVVRMRTEEEINDLIEQIENLR